MKKLKCLNPECNYHLTEQRVKRGLITCSTPCGNAWNHLPKKLREEIRGKKYNTKEWLPKKFKQGELTKESYQTIMHDLQSLEFKKTKDNKYHYKLLKGNLKDIFGTEKKCLIPKCKIKGEDEFGGYCAKHENQVWEEVIGDL